MPDLSIVLFSRQRIDVYPDNTDISDIIVSKLVHATPIMLHNAV